MSREEQTVVKFMPTDHVARRVVAKPIPGSAHWNLLFQTHNGDEGFNTTSAVEVTTKPEFVPLEDDDS